MKSEDDVTNHYPIYIKKIQRYEEFRKIENTPLKRTFVLYWQCVIMYEK
ncbi:MAG: hypothetical protein ACTIDZ_07020 [Staphylococcus sp.]